MTLRRVMLVVALVLLVLCAVLAGIVAADWPYLQRVIAITQLPDGGEWPESFYQPVAKIDGGGAGAFFPPAPAGATTIDPAALEAAAQWAGSNNSVALLVLHRGRVQLERYWQGMTADTPFSGRAMSRSLVGLVYGAAVADGRLSLDDPAAKYLDEWRGDPRGAITIRQLMQNVSGLEEVALNAPPLAADAGPIERTAAFLRTATGKNTRISLGTDFGAAALSFRLEHEPGGRFAFSNANSQLLGLILERATGTAFERYVEQQLWAPLGAGIGEFYMDRAHGMPAVYCCFRASPRDFLRVGALLAGDGVFDGRQVLPRGWVARMARDTSTVNPLYGLQVWSGRARRGTREYLTGSGQGVPHGEDFLAADVIWMEGGGGRSVWAIPSQQLVIVRLGRASPTWDGSVLPNTILRGLSPSAAPDPAPPAAPVAGAPP
jgi:CubicO group peptidase (beta-lactamase class C family)